MRGLLILISFCPLFHFAQESKPQKTGEYYEHYLTLQTGFGRTHLAMSDALGYNNYGWESNIVNQSSSPGLFLNYDYYWTRRFSVNACLGMNTAKISGNAYPVMPIQKGRVITWSTRLLVHFLHVKSLRSNLYFGAGVGIGIWSFKPDKNLEQIYNGSNAQFSLPIFLGYRYFFLDNLGATLELSTFNNNHISAGLTFRF